MVYCVEFSGRVRVHGRSYIEANSPEEAEERFFEMIDNGMGPSDDVDYGDLDSDWIDVDNIE